MDFEIYKRKLLEEDERNRLSELQTKYNGIKTPDYANMSLRDELQTRFDLDELNNLQQKYGVQQTSALKSQITASSPQSSYVQPISSQQPNFPFSEFEKAYFYEKRSQFFQGSQDEENQGFEDNKTDENAKSFGPKIALKNQRVALKNATLLQSGWGGWIRTNE